MPVPQNYKNHTRFDPRFHFFVIPVLLLNILVAIILAIRYWPILHWLGLWMIIVATALGMTALLARLYNLKNQDRVIRLEEHLRYATLLTPRELSLAHSLSLRQIVALRFASDAELPVLLQRAAAENLAPKQIKESIQVWRADTSRI